MPWTQIMLGLLEQYLQWRFGPLMAVGLFLVTVGFKARSANLFCIGGILVLLVILSMK